MFSKEEEKRIRSTSSQLIEQHTDVDVTKVLTMGIEALDEFGPDRKEDFDKFEKIVITDTSEGYGLIPRLRGKGSSNRYWRGNNDPLGPDGEGFVDIFGSKLYLIADGFAPETGFEKFFPKWNYKKQIFKSANLSFWWAWNKLFNKYKTWTGKITMKLHLELKRNVNSLFSNESNRKHKFISLNHNFKQGRELLTHGVSHKFLEENYINNHFIPNRTGFKFDFKPIKSEDGLVQVSEDINDDRLTSSGDSPFYDVIFNEHRTTAYIAPYFESPAMSDAYTDWMLMITEKSVVWTALGCIVIPMNQFYVAELEKIGFKFVKEINGVNINETEDWNLKKYKLWELSRDQAIETSKKWTEKQVERLERINKENTLEEIQKVHEQNTDLIEHNQKLLKKLLVGDEFFTEIEEWLK